MNQENKDYVIDVNQIVIEAKNNIIKQVENKIKEQQEMTFRQQIHNNTYVCTFQVTASIIFALLFNPLSLMCVWMTADSDNKDQQPYAIRKYIYVGGACLFALQILTVIIIEIIVCFKSKQKPKSELK